MVKLVQNSPGAVQGWIPLCRMFGVDTGLVRNAGGERRARKKRAKLTRLDKCWRALARDPKAQVRMVARKTPCPKNGMRGTMQLRPKGNIFIEPGEAPPWFKRTARMQREGVGDCAALVSVS
jgi:hypothetical protein